MSTSRDNLHRLVDDLTDDQLRDARRLLEALRGADAVGRAFLTAPIDDEPVTQEETAEHARTVEAIESDDLVSLDDVKRSLGM